MPSPRRNGKRWKDKPVVIIFPGSPIGYLGGMSMSSEGERCLKFANEMEARAWVMGQKMLGGVHDVHLCSDILKHIDKGEKVIRCDSRLTYGPNSIWTGRSTLYDYGIDVGPAEETTRTTPQCEESALASEPSISSAHAGSRNIYDDLVHSVNSIYSQHLARYEQSRVAPPPEVTIDRDQPRVTADRDLYEMISNALSGARSRPSDLSESLGVSPSTSDSAHAAEEREQPGQTVTVGPNIRNALNDIRAEQVSTTSTENAAGNAVSAVSEERARLEQRYIAEFLEHGRDQMSRHEFRYEDCAGTCYDPR